MSAKASNSHLHLNEARLPTARELQQIATWLAAHSLGVVMDDWFKSAWITVFDQYITDCPGYSGKVVVVVWGAGPDTVSVFTEEDGALVLSSSHDDTCGSHDEA